MDTLFSMDLREVGDLDLWRYRIDSIDEELVGLINQRAECAIAIGRIKAQRGVATYQQAREKQVIANLSSVNRGPMHDVQLAPIWQAIMRASRDLQTHGEVAYLGPAGTYSEDAMRAYFGEMTLSKPCASIDDVFYEITEGRVTHAVVPIENSTEGPVTRTVDLLFETSASIEGEVVIPVRHCLLAVNGSVDGIECVMGHAQALAQCRKWLDTKLPAVRRVEVASNAEAAQRAAGSSECAAVAGGHAAVKYGLRVVAEGIQDMQDNCTRFVILGHAAAATTGFDRTTLAVYLQNSPGALARLLAPLARHQVSVLWVEARPRHAAPWTYRFLLDLAGHRDEPEVAAALQDLASVVEEYRVIGSYPRFEKRFMRVDTVSQVAALGDSPCA